jgi:ABC-type transporter Mla subunit MlaD
MTDVEIIPNAIEEPIVEAVETVPEVAEAATEPVTDVIEATAETVADAIQDVSEFGRIHARLDRQDDILTQQTASLAELANNINAAIANVATTAVETTAEVAETAAEIPAETIDTVIEGDVDPPNIKRRGHMIRRRR